MDEAFTIFIKEFGGSVERQYVPGSSVERYQGKLPERLLKYWEEYGWCGYGNGLFWIVNPGEYEGVVASWLEGLELPCHDTYHLIARSAFGDLYLWGEKTGFAIKITSVLSRCVINNFSSSPEEMDRDFQDFLVSMDVDSNNYGGFFEAAKKKLGALRHDEMYGFVPALMLGGAAKLECLQKVKAVEHLIFLSQLAELEPYSFSDF